MLIGLPASGKTYFRKTVEGQILSTDDYVHEYAKAEGKSYSEVFQEAIKAAETKMKDDLLYAVERDMDIIWDQTNLSKKARAKKLAQLPEYYAKVAIFIVAPEQEEWEGRLAARTDQQIPTHILRSMQKQIEFPSKDEGFDGIVVIENNEEKVYC